MGYDCDQGSSRIQHHWKRAALFIAHGFDLTGTSAIKAFFECLQGFQRGNTAEEPKDCQLGRLPHRYIFLFTHFPMRAIFQNHSHGTQSTQ